MLTEIKTIEGGQKKMSSLGGPTLKKTTKAGFTRDVSATFFGAERLFSGLNGVYQR